MNNNRNGQRSFWLSLRDAFDGLVVGSKGKVMRIIYGLLVLSALMGVLRGANIVGWILLSAFGGAFVSHECTNNAWERHEDRLNRLIRELKKSGVQLNGWEEENSDSLYIKHQSAASVLAFGLGALIAGLLVFFFNP